MSEGNEPKKISGESSRRTTKIPADLDHVKLSPMIHHLVEKMSDEHWRIVREALCILRTKVEVGHLCQGIVVRVVRMARCYLLPAFLEVQGVPTAHVLTCGSNRVNTSEARNAAKPFLGQETQGITNEMLLAAAKNEVDKVILASVRIVSGSETAVPIFLEDPTRVTDLGRNYYPSDPLSETVAGNLVGEVFHFMNENGVSDQDVHSPSFSIVGHVIKHVQGAFESALAIGAVSLNKVYAASERLFSAMRRAVEKLSPRPLISSGGAKDVTMADARDLISQVIVAMQHQVPEPKSPEDLEQGLLVHGILGALLKEVKRPQSPRQPSLQSSRKGSPQSPQRDGGSKLCGAPVQPDLIPEGIPLVLICPSDGLSPVSAGETVTRLVDVIFEWEKCPLTTGRREQVMVEQCSHGIACTVQKILRNHPGLQTVQVPAGKSVSDSALLRMCSRPVDKNKIPFGLVYSYMEEAVKRLVRSSLFPAASNQCQLEASGDLTGELHNTLDDLTRLVTQEAMMNLSRQLEEDMASQGNSRKLADEQGQAGGFVSPQEIRDKTQKKTVFSRLRKLFNWKKSGASKAGATVTPSKTVPQLIEAPVAARPEETQEETTARCWCFKIPKLKFSFKKIMKRAKVGPETQLDETTAELPPSGSGLAEEETGSGLAYVL